MFFADLLFEMLVALFTGLVEIFLSGLSATGG